LEVSSFLNMASAARVSKQTKADQSRHKQTQADGGRQRQTRQGCLRVILCSVRVSADRSREKQTRVDKSRFQQTNSKSNKGTQMQSGPGCLRRVRAACVSSRRRARYLREAMLCKFVSVVHTHELIEAYRGRQRQAVADRCRYNKIGADRKFI
jgi:hypothetical protein